MNIAVLGTGLMGAPIARRALAAGHRVSVYNRTRAKAEALAGTGAVVCDSPSEAVLNAECVLMVLSDKSAIDACLSKIPDWTGKTLIQMSTIAPEESIELHENIRQQGGVYLECPVLGSRNEAENGVLILLVGSEQEEFDRRQEFLKAFGPNPRRIGGVGQAAAIKLALNHLIAAHAASFSLSLGIVRKRGIDVDTFMSILKDSTLTAPMFQRKLPNWMNHDYADPNFPLKHMFKDVGLIAGEARHDGLNDKIIEAIRAVMEEAVKSGDGDKDYSSVYETIVRRQA